MDEEPKSSVMDKGNSEKEKVVETIDLEQDRVYFKIDFDFKNQTDKADFYYSLDGVEWKSIGNTLQMEYTLPHFMGYRFALFNYATKTEGGYVDFDYFRIDDKTTGTEESPTELQLDKEEAQEVTAGKTCTVQGTISKLTMPSDLPVGTKVKVETKNVEDTNYEGLTPAGDHLTFTI